MLTLHKQSRLSTQFLALLSCSDLSCEPLGGTHIQTSTYKVLSPSLLPSTRTVASAAGQQPPLLQQRHFINMRTQKPLCLLICEPEHIMPGIAMEIIFSVPHISLLLPLWLLADQL